MRSRKLGIAFLKGVRMFGQNNISGSGLRAILREIESKHSNNVKFLGIYGVHSDIVVFKKQGVHYATIGQWIETGIKQKFGLEIPVTTRSLQTIKKVVERFKER